MKDDQQIGVICQNNKTVESLALEILIANLEMLVVKMGKIPEDRYTVENHWLDKLAEKDTGEEDKMNTKEEMTEAKLRVLKKTVVICVANASAGLTDAKDISSFALLIEEAGH